MLNIETYARLSSAGAPMFDHESGMKQKDRMNIRGSDKTRAQEITCQLPSRRERRAPSA
ncbi:hypothetical protein MUS_0548 [Bacillus velezensis YAU B9601-Y2]|uniref:Uncharacterized protein n=1 Tax=Bacillus amyloliquefaciens (strain Y2) TaxID=1155777 RepID=I2C1U6_BACAY|nr:hypothetical protein MUS_0548 [Bacillus velezensis YAU B9601-Y2]